MNDPWMNQGYEHNILKPHTEEPADYCDPERIGRCSFNYLFFERISISSLMIKNVQFFTILLIFLILKNKKNRLLGKSQ